MADTTQNDWDVVEQALIASGRTEAEHPPLMALSRLREFTAFTIQSLNARITELEAELKLREPDEGWPTPAPLREDYWESAG